MDIRTAGNCDRRTTRSHRITKSRVNACEAEFSTRSSRTHLTNELRRLVRGQYVAGFGLVQLLDRGDYVVLVGRRNRSHDLQVIHDFARLTDQ